MTIQKNWRWLAIALMFLACVTVTACNGATAPKATGSKFMSITEVSPPLTIAKLSHVFDNVKPQLRILTPQPDQLLTDNQVEVRLDVQGLAIFKNKEFGLGPHAHIALDGQEYRAIYDLSQPLLFSNLAPGSHTIRAFASRPWHESFKNKGAYAQVTFHVFTPTLENLPQPDLPLLTYSRPVGNYGAEPIMLDFYIHSAPFTEVDLDRIRDWQVRATINDETFVTDRWQPLYLKGLKEGRNWVKLELIDAKGSLIPNSFSSTAHLLNYQPNGTDTLARITRNEIIPDLEAIVNPNYVPPAPPEPPVPEVTPAPKVEEPSIPEATPAPKAEESSIPEVAPAPDPTPVSSPEPSPKRKKLKLRRSPPATEDYR